MPGPRRRLFGPLFYSTLVGALLVLIYVGALQVPDWLGDRWRSFAERRQIEELTQGLRSPDEKVRQQSAWALLLKMPEVYRPILHEAARDPNDEVRALVCQHAVAGRVDPVEALDLLVGLADDRSESVRVFAAEGMGRLVAMSTVGDRREEVRRVLRRYLKDSSPKVRAVSASSIGALGRDPEVADDLIAALDDDDRSVRLAAARSLIQVKGPDDPSAVRALIAMVSIPEAVADRRDILRAISTVSPPIRDRAAGMLAHLIRTADPDTLPDLLATVAEAGTWAKGAEPALESLLDHPEPDIRALAALAIFAVECPGIAQFLPLGNSDGMTKECMLPGFNGPARRSLISPKAEAALARAIGDPMIPKDLRMNAVALIQMAGPSAITRVTPALVRQLADPNPAVRLIALELLGQLLDRAPAALPTTDASK